MPSSPHPVSPTKRIYEVRRPRWVPFVALVLMPVQLLGLIVATVSLYAYALMVAGVLVDWRNIPMALLLVVATLVSCASLPALDIASGKRKWLVAMILSTAVVFLILLIDAREWLPETALTFMLAAASMFVFGLAMRLFGRLGDDERWRKYYRDRNACWHCDYSLQGLTGLRCPECGAELSPHS